MRYLQICILDGKLAVFKDRLYHPIKLPSYHVNNLGERDQGAVEVQGAVEIKRGAASGALHVHCQTICDMTMILAWFGPYLQIWQSWTLFNPFSRSSNGSRAAT